jgi:hypothetical protein
MIYSYIIPPWFIGFDIIIQFLFAIVSIAVAVYAYKVYKISKEKNIEQFSLGFLFISISYILMALVTLFIYFQISGGPREIAIEHLQLTGLVGLILYMSLFIIGLINLFWVNNKKNKKETYFLIIILGLLAVFTNFNYIAAFHLTASIILLFINFHYAKDYIKNKNHKTLLVFIAFIFLFLGHAEFLFPVTYSEYVIAHLLELVSYTLILVSLIRTLRK